MNKTEITLNELEQRTLSCIVNNPNMMTSDLTRRMHSMGVTDESKRKKIIKSLETKLELIQSKTKPFELGKRGRRPKIFSATENGKRVITEIITNNKKSK